MLFDVGDFHQQFFYLKKQNRHLKYFGTKYLVFGKLFNKKVPSSNRLKLTEIVERLLSDCPKLCSGCQLTLLFAVKM